MNSFDELKLGETVYLCPAGGASRKMYNLIRSCRPDICVKMFLDSYKSTVNKGGDIKRIDELESHEIDIRVIIVIEREKVRKDLVDVLEISGFDKISCVDNSFSVNVLEANHENSNIMHFIYDLSVNALNYEFVVSLVHADSERKRLGFKWLHPVIIYSNNSPVFDLSRESIRSEGAVLESSNYWFIYNVIIPSMSLLPSCKGYTLFESRSEALRVIDLYSGSMFPVDYSIGSPVELDSIRNTCLGDGYGQPLKSNQSSISFVQQWIDMFDFDRDKCIVITLRQNLLSEERNSDMSAWKCFADKVRVNGYVPIFVKDTYSDFDADDLNGYSVFSPASWNIFLRMALYEVCYLNMTVNTGTIALCMFNKNVRYINFAYVSDEHYAGSYEFHEASGSHIGSQYPGSSSFQKTVWGGGDSCDVIFNEFMGMVDKIESANICG